MILKDDTVQPTSYDATTGEHRDKTGLIEQPDTQTNRAQSYALRESGVDYFCYLANIKQRGVVYAHYLWTTISE